MEQGFVFDSAFRPEGVSVQDSADPLSGVVVPNMVATKDVKAATQGICFDLEFS